MSSVTIMTSVKTLRSISCSGFVCVFISEIFLEQILRVACWQAAVAQNFFSCSPRFSY